MPLICSRISWQGVLSSFPWRTDSCEQCTIVLMLLLSLLLLRFARTCWPQPVAEEPTPNTSGQVSLIITSCGLGTYDATKIIQEIRPELGTFDTYQLMRDFPNTIADNLEPDAAAQFKKRLEDAGCTVEIK